jgi:hypothetical protein
VVSKDQDIFSKLLIEQILVEHVKKWISLYLRK